MKTQLAVLVACFMSAGCAKKQEPARRTEPWLANPSGASSVATANAPLPYRFTKESRITFSLPGRKATPRGHVPLLGGELRLNVGDLMHSTARLEADLTALELDPESLPADATSGGGSLSAVARQWLDLGSTAQQERTRGFGRATFELVSLEALSVPSLTTNSPARGRDQVHATVVGTLLLHGFRAPMRAQVTLELKPQPGNRPPTVAIRSRSPFVVSLATHDISARDASGTPLPLEAKRWFESIGKDARVELDLVAEPMPPPSP